VAKRQIDEESRIIKLAEAAHDVWYPQEAYADFSPPKNEPKRRYHYLAANITANDPHFDPAVFTLKIPKGFVVEDLTKPASKQPAAQVDPKQLRVQSVANLRQVVQSAKMYADQHEGQGPKSLDVLKKAGLIDEALACPVPHHQYVYVGYEKKMNPLAVVAYEKSEDAGDPVSIAFAGGAVHQFPPADAERIIANGESDADDWK
jgi:hypothetical protein